MRLIPSARRVEPITTQDVVAALLAGGFLAGLIVTVIHLAGEWRAANAAVSASRALIAEEARRLADTAPGPAADGAATTRDALDRIDARMRELERSAKRNALHIDQGRAGEWEAANRLAAERAAAIAQEVVPGDDGWFDPGPEPSGWKWIGLSHHLWAQRKQLSDVLNARLRAVQELMARNRALHEAGTRLARELEETQAARNRILAGIAGAAEAAQQVAADSARAMREADAAARTIDAERVARARREVRDHPWTRFALIAMHAPVALYFLALGLRFALRLALLRRWLRPRRIAV